MAADSTIHGLGQLTGASVDQSADELPIWDNSATIAKRITIAEFLTGRTLVTPALGTPASGTLTSCTGLPAAGVVGTAAILAANTFTATQTITLAAANTGVLASTGYSLTGSNATNMIDLAGTWNTSGNPTAIKLNITNTASGSSSLLMDLQVGSVTQFNVTKGASDISTD